MFRSFSADGRTFRRGQVLEPAELEQMRNVGALESAGFIVWSAAPPSLPESW